MPSGWYYSINGTEYGPVPSAELAALARGGRLKPTDLVRKEGMAEWLPAGRVKGLFPPAAAPAPAPPATPAEPPGVASAAKGLFDAVAGAAKRAGEKVAEATKQPLPKPRIKPVAAADSETEGTSPPGSSPQQPALPKVSRRTRIIAGVGCGTLLLSCIMCGVIGAIFRNDPPSGTKVVGDTATFDMTIRGNPLMSVVDTTASEMAQGVWKTARAHPGAKKCVVKVTMSKEGMEDKYGKAWEKDLEMGEVVIADLDEVRKYKDADAYAVNDFVRAGYVYRIKQLNGSHLLGK